MRVLVTHNPEDLEAYYGRALLDLAEVEGVEIRHNPLGREFANWQELSDAAEGCHVIVAHRSTAGDAELFDSPKTASLCAFLRTAVDISTIDVGAATAHGVLVARAGKAFVPSTAELALGLFLSVSRNIAASKVDYHLGEEPPQRPGRQVHGQTAAILGYGAIGSYLSPLLLALGLNVVVHDPDVTVTVPGVEGLSRASFEEALAIADAVFVLASANESTERLIDDNALALMRDGSVLINVARGELIDDDAVVAALDSGRLRGLGIDVGRAADQRPAMALAARPDVVATPHLGGLTPENADAQARSSVEQIQAMIAGTLPPRSVNPQDAARLGSYWAGRE